jgi:hypothetical protein
MLGWLRSSGGASGRPGTMAIGLTAVAVVLAVSVARTGAIINLPAPLVGAAPVPGEPPAPPAGLARHRVLLVIIDGLRADEAARLPFLATLTAAGARAQLWGDPPTYSSAQYVSLFTGVPPCDSGIRGNERLRPAGVEDVATVLRRTGRHTLGVSTEVDWWVQLFPQAFDFFRVLTFDQVSAEVTPRWAGADLVLVHIAEPDLAAHAAGARSPPYRQAAAHAADLSATLARAWGWPDATVAVMSDHGHRDGGGHGGDEPEVREAFLILSGPGVQPGGRVANARMVDAAPTLAALLGAPAPQQASGRALSELLQTPVRAALGAQDAERLARLAPALAQASARLAAIESRQQIYRGLAVGLGLLLLLALAHGKRELAGFALGLVGLGLALLVFRLIFGPVSLSAARRAAIWGIGTGVIAFACAAVLLALALRAQARLRTLLGIVAGFSPPALAAFVHAGLFAPRFTCRPPWLVAAIPLAYTICGGACLAGALGCVYWRRRYWAQAAPLLAPGVGTAHQAKAPTPSG